MSSPPPPYFSEEPDLLIPIPNTQSWLPLTWAHAKAIERLERFFARLFRRVGESDEKDGLEKYQQWMTTLFHMRAEIYVGC